MSNHSDTRSEMQKPDAIYAEKSSSTNTGAVDDRYDDDVDVAPKMHFKTYIVVIASSLAFLTYVWQVFQFTRAMSFPTAQRGAVTSRGLVAFGLNQRIIAAVVGSPENYVFIQNASNLVSLVVAPPMGRISDNIGRKWLVLVCQFYAQQAPRLL